MSKIFLIEYYWYGDYKLLGCYDNEKAAIDHINDLNTIREYGKSLSLIEVGVRSKKQLRKVYTKVILCQT